MPVGPRHHSATVVSRRPAITPRRIAVLAKLPHPRATEPPPAAYLDYARSLTPEGGVSITYRDIDTRWRWWLWRILAWSSATGFDGWIVSDQSPLQSSWLGALPWLAAAGLNLLIVLRPIEVVRRIEVRPDCLILEGSEVFWRRQMDAGWPELHEKDEKTFIFGGVYGTRFVEFGTLRRFDDNDRQPETFAAHVKQAMEQLWSV